MSAQLNTWETIYPERYLKAADLGGRTKKCTITAVDLEEMPNDGTTRAVLSFRETQKKLSLNKTNSRTLSLAFGPQVNACIGKEIEIFVVPVNMPGRGPLEGIRIKLPVPATPDITEDVNF